MNPGVLELHSTIMAELVKITSISQTIIHTINFSVQAVCFGGERHYTRI